MSENRQVPYPAFLIDQVLTPIIWTQKEEIFTFRKFHCNFLKQEKYEFPFKNRFKLSPPVSNELLFCVLNLWKEMCMNSFFCLLLCSIFLFFTRVLLEVWDLPFFWKYILGKWQFSFKDINFYLKKKTTWFTWFFNLYWKWENILQFLLSFNFSLHPNYGRI